MGKSQKKKSMRRHNPMRVPDSHLPKGLEAASQSSSKSEAILPIIQKMEGVDVAERKWACVAVSNLIQNDPSTRRLLQGKNIVGALITRLTDSEEEVVVEAMGALRNLCIDGGYDICAEMYNKNIITPLKTFVPKISDTLSQYLSTPKAATEGVQRAVFQFADNVITTLWCLSETSNKALNAINEMHLIPFLLSFLLSRDKLPLSTVTAAAQSLYVLTDDNRPAIDDIRADAGYLACLLDIARQGHSNESPDARSVTLSVLAAGTLRNVSPIPPPSTVSSVEIDRDIVLPLLQSVITSVSLLDITTQVQGLVAQQASEPQIEKLSLKHTPKSDHKTPAEIELERLEENLRTVQLALEVLTGLCAILPDPGPDSPSELVEDGEDLDMEDDRMDTEMENPAESSEPHLLPSLIPPLLALIYPTALSFPPLAAPSTHPPTTSALSAIHISALECMNNLFLSIATKPDPAVAKDTESGRKVWNDVWTALDAIGTQSGLGQERRQEAWEIAVGVLWGISNIWKGTLIPTEEHITVLTQLCETFPSSTTKVKCIGTLECLAQYSDSVNFNRIISSYLLSMLPTETTTPKFGTEPMIQAASALIDIYSDENMPYDSNFRDGNFLEQLSASVDGVRLAVRAIDRRKEGGKELRRRGEEVRDNLVDFIQYRRDLAS